MSDNPLGDSAFGTTTEFSMFSDYQRVGNICLRLDFLATKVNMREAGYLKEAYATLHTLYNNLYAIIWDNIDDAKTIPANLAILKSEVDKTVDLIKRDLDAELSDEVIATFNNTHKSLMRTKQKIGLGFNMKKRLSVEQKLENALGME